MANKKNNWQLITLALLLLFIAVPVYAQLLPPPPSASDFGPPSSLAEPILVPCGRSVDGVIQNPCDYQDFLQLMVNVFDYLTKYIAIPLAVATIVIGGVIMMTAGTNDGKRSEAKKIIWMAVWGLVIVLASWLIVKQVFSSLVDPNFTPDSFKS